MKTASFLIRLSVPLLTGLLVLLNILLPPFTRGERAVLTALGQLDKPYIFATAGPDSFDCSGLVKYCYAPLGIALTHSAQGVGYDGRYCTLQSTLALVPGDLVFFDTVADNDLCDHVGLWLGGNRFVHASSTGRVMISAMDEKWRTRYSWAKRVACPFF